MKVFHKQPLPLISAEDERDEMKDLESALKNYIIDHRKIKVGECVQPGFEKKKQEAKILNQ
jgi:hypothetical protein